MGKPESHEVTLLRNQLLAAQDRGMTVTAQASLLRDELRSSQAQVGKLLAIVERQGEIVQGLVVRLGAPQAQAQVQQANRCPSCGQSGEVVKCSRCDYRYRPT